MAISNSYVSLPEGNFQQAAFHMFVFFNPYECMIMVPTLSRMYLWNQHVLG